MSEVISLDRSWSEIHRLYRIDEESHVRSLLKSAAIEPHLAMKIHDNARHLVEKQRSARKAQGGMDAFMRQYDLSSDEGIALMCVAEALLRIPDTDTVDALIKDKLSSADWGSHMGKSDSTFVNAATLGLICTNRVLSDEKKDENFLFKTVKKLVNRTSEPVIRQAIRQGMKVLSKQFVMGEDITEAIKRSKPNEKKGYRYSYDMLGEAAYTQADAQRYFEAYLEAIEKVGQDSLGKGPIEGGGVSVKLSALHPRYEIAQSERVMDELYDRVKVLCLRCQDFNINLTIDAEESERLVISLQIIEKLAKAPELASWHGLGLAVQAYQKRAIAVVDWVVALAQETDKKILIRLVKGAYWDSEIKNSQITGVSGYSVFTRKASTDLSYLACAQKLLQHRRWIYPQFATHNAHTVCAIRVLSGDERNFEFQGLYGMGDTLYEQTITDGQLSVPCRLYAPVGTHKELLAYLVRRLLENGANTSFVNRIDDESQSVEQIIADPFAQLNRLESIVHPHIPLPINLYGAVRKNAPGLDLSDTTAVTPVLEALKSAELGHFRAKPKTDESKGAWTDIVNPACTSEVVGRVFNIEPTEIDGMLTKASTAFKTWHRQPVAHRAQCLNNLGDLIVKHQDILLTILCKEAGKILADGISEVREAADFCYYYASQAIDKLAPETLQGPTGEKNELHYHGKGVAVCISPWNFPCAIFTGQVVASLASGNTVIAKPAAQTPLVAAKMIELMHEAGIPSDAVQLLTASGRVIGDALLSDDRVSLVMFTGSGETAKTIQRTLANREGQIVPLIAETGGQNAMIIDSSALAEQVVEDVINSAFLSAGQRCSACRVLFVQSDVADRTITMLKGAIEELKLGNPHFHSTDIGPVIDKHAKASLEAHIHRFSEQYTFVAKADDSAVQNTGGCFVAPHAIEIPDLSVLKEEVFGPVLHIIRYKADALDDVIDAINGTGFGLTLGIHSRIHQTIDYICERANVGNIYINRDMVGAVVGVQPFGGEGLSGTGPKAGGPNILRRLSNEKTVSENMTAIGGNATLMTIPD